jgi:hypothetical protein
MHPRALPSRTVRAGVVTCVLLLAGTACSSSDDPRGDASSPDLSPAPVKKADKEKAAVVETLTMYNAAVKASMPRSRRPVPIRRIRAVVAEPYATQLGKQLAVQHSAGLVMRGQDVYTTRSVAVHQDRATLVTCWDPSKADIVNVLATPQQTVAPAPATLTTFRLKKVGGTWKITKRVPGRAC